MRQMKWFAVVLFIAVAGCTRKQAETPPPKDPEVEVVQPVFGEITDYEDFTGRTDSVEAVEIKARVNGYLKKLNFKDGDDVRGPHSFCLWCWYEGDLLFEIEPDLYQAQLDEAIAQGKLVAAQVKFAKSDYDRFVRLHTQGSATQEDVERAFQAWKVAEAQVDVAKATLKQREINMGYTKVRAPFDGRLSRRFMDPRNIVKADDTLLTRIVALDPMYVNFDVDERSRMRIARLVNKGQVQSYRAMKGKMLVWVGLADEQDDKIPPSPYKGYPHEGYVDFVDNRMDEGTGTLRVRAVIANHDKLIKPGQFARLRLPVGKPYNALQVPEAALGTDQGVKFVYVVNKEDKVEYRQVRVGPMHSGLRVIMDETKPDRGVRKGERVIVGGLQRVRPGIKVTIRAPKKPGVNNSDPTKK
jgi:RND family efflux transporter MFP subunit